MRPVSPTQEAVKSHGGLLRAMKSTYQALAGGLAYASPTGSKDSTGVFNTFNADNVDNSLFRIGANGSTDNQYAWDGAGVVTINHGLMRQPIGFKLLDKDKACDVYRTGGAPTADTIQLTCSDITANVTVEIF